MDWYSLLFFLAFLCAGLAVLANVVKNIRQWNKNNHSPRLTVEADVVAKRTHVTHHQDTEESSRSTTTYYATFQVESGDRMELRIPTWEYGLLVEGDHGKLTFQGTRYLGFQRG